VIGIGPRDELSFLKLSNLDATPPLRLPSIQNLSLFKDFAHLSLYEGAPQKESYQCFFFVRTFFSFFFFFLSQCTPISGDPPSLPGVVIKNTEGPQCGELHITPSAASAPPFP